MFSLDQFPLVNAGDCGPVGGPMAVGKTEEMGRPMDFAASRIGLNLGGRTYFSNSEVGSSATRTMLFSSNNNSPRCQAEGCNADLAHAKHYHRRHKVCENHSKAATVIVAGLTQRFCQQCSRWFLQWRNLR